VRISDGERAVVSYTTGPGGAQILDGRSEHALALPAGAPDLEGFDADARAVALRAWVTRRMRYTNVPRPSALDGPRGDFVARALSAGEGDCDVVNGLLALLLQRANVPARLAIGYVGHRGRTEPLLHAWVEYRAPTGAWKVIDASDRSPTELDDRAIAYSSGSRARADAPAPTAPVLGLFSTPARPTRSPPAVSVLAGPSTSAAARLQTPKEPGLPRGLFGLVGLVPLMGFALMLMRSRVRRHLQLDAEHDISLLLQGALARPDAFLHVSALFEQPLIPCRGRRPISLGEAYELAAAETLYCSDVGSAFTDRALKSRAIVLELHSREGRVVADALGAVNLDQWDELLRSTESCEVLAHANAYLKGHHEAWTLMCSARVTREPALLTVPGSHDQRWVVVNGDAPWLQRATALFSRRPQRALLELLDEVSLAMRVPEERRARLLAPLAAAALIEHEAAAPEKR
jgi:hypothetical protein